MPGHEDFYAALADRVRQWSKQHADIRAVIQVGSRTRADHPADRWSDADFMIYTSAPETYLASRDWVSALGTPWIVTQSRTAGGDAEVLVLFEGGYNADFVLVPLRSLEWLVQNKVSDALFQRGARILLDRDGLAEDLLKLPVQEYIRPIPREEEFQAACCTFWYGSHYLARQIRRGDFWLLKVRDGEMKQLLLGMLELHARTVCNPLRDTWHMGRFIQEWADPRAVRVLDQVFAHYDAADSWRGLRASMDLFSWLAVETADKLGYAYPAEAESRARGLIGELENKLD